jgi:2-oxoglutarate dehydrogenase E1 component
VKLRNIIERLNRAYCSTIGIEYMYISGREECNFLREKFENLWINYVVSKEEKFHLHTRLSWAVLFEEFLQTKFTTHKRFGLEGLDSLIVGLKSFVDYSVSQGVGDITLGMAHRGRLNVLANVFKKPLSKIFAEFQGKWGESDDGWEHSGDVKYHLGTHYERVYQNGMKVKLDISPNPSHLEAVNPVVQGQTRAKQHFNKDNSREKHIAILIHGDASFAGQGVVYESTQMQNLDDYEVGGILHVIANNQIGFTTSPKEGRSTPFCCDLAKAYQAPIIHVNADDPEAVEYAFKVAAEYRIKFKKDVVLDVIGYRRHGHNELDQPFFTQPLMYNIISNHKNVLSLYEAKLLNEGMTQVFK